MVDFYDSIFWGVKNAVEAKCPECSVVMGGSAKPARYPSCAVTETNNQVIALDSELREKFARVQYSIQIASAKREGKRMETMKILQVVDDFMARNNFRRTGKTETPDLYHASVFKLTVVYEGGIGSDGRTFKST